LLAVKDKVLNSVYNVNFLNATSIRRAAAHGRVPKELGEKLKGVPDAMFCMPLGLIGGRDACPTTGPGRAVTLKAPALGVTRAASNGAVMGPNADVTAMTEVFTILKESLKPNQKLRNVLVGNVSSRIDLSNKAIKLLKETVGEDKIIGEVGILDPVLAFAIVAAWGSVFVAYWVDEGN
jgi:hypothetical protein